MKIRTGLGQDSHAFETDISMLTQKPLLLGGIYFDNMPALRANSDGDVVLHALTNAISSVTGVIILGKIADELCQQGIVDSRVYVREALKYLHKGQICHVAISIECQKPKITPRIPEMKQSISDLLGIQTEDVGITATSGEGLTAVGQGLGIQVFCLITVIET